MHVSAGSNLTDTNVLVPMYHTPTVFMHVRFFFRDVCVLEFLPIQTRPQYFIKKMEVQWLRVWNMGVFRSTTRFGSCGGYLFFLKSNVLAVSCELPAEKSPCPSAHPSVESTSPSTRGDNTAKRVQAVYARSSQRLALRCSEAVTVNCGNLKKKQQQS